MAKRSKSKGQGPRIGGHRMPPPDRQCHGTSSTTGCRCTAWTVKGQDYCRRHGPKAAEAAARGGKKTAAKWARVQESVKNLPLRERSAQVDYVIHCIEREEQRRRPAQGGRPAGGKGTGRRDTVVQGYLRLLGKLTEQGPVASHYHLHHTTVMPADAVGREPPRPPEPPPGKGKANG